MPLPAVPVADAKLGLALRARFEELGITRESIRERTERGDNLKGPFTATRRAALEDDPLSVAVRFFFCGSFEAPMDLELTLGSKLFLAAGDAGLFIPGPDEYWSMPFHLRPVRGLWLFSDYLGGDPDSVMGAGETTGILFEASHRPGNRTERVLDLGCGAGSLALLLAGYGQTVIGTDINHRAVALARWNAAVNGIENVAFREGSLFEPVAMDEPFDLIVSQPPYYPTPEGQARSLAYLHGGPRGDELATQILEGLGVHLSTRGRALVFTSWPTDRRRSGPAGLRVLELFTNQREVHGMPQSLNVIERATESRWTQFQVPADDWGETRPPRIDQLLSADDLLHAPPGVLEKAVLRIPPGVALTREGDSIVLRYPPQALVGTIQIDDPLWRTLSTLDAVSDVRRALDAGIPEAVIRTALTRGLLLTPERGLAQLSQ